MSFFVAGVVFHQCFDPVALAIDLVSLSVVEACEGSFEVTEQDGKDAVVLHEGCDGRR